VHVNTDGGVYESEPFVVAGAATGESDPELVLVGDTRRLVAYDDVGHDPPYGAEHVGVRALDDEPTPPAPPDAGVPDANTGTADAAPADAAPVASPDAGVSPPASSDPDDGCGCRVGGGAPGGLPGAAVALLAVWALRRRRRP
jgi:MYXO-CTERM domain-containing protein